MGDRTTRSSLEKQMYGYLKQLNISFSEQQPTRTGFVIDFVIELRKKDGSAQEIDLEVDGTQWHSSTAQRKRDMFRDACMREAGYAVIRIREPFTLQYVKEQIHEIARQCNCISPFHSFRSSEET